MTRAVIPAVLLAACAPQNAELVSGSYIAFLSDGTSLSLSKEQVIPEKYDTTYNMDCREFATPEDEAALRLEDPIDICGPNKWPPEFEEWGVQAGYRVVSEELEPWRGEALITSEGDLQIAFHHHVPGGADMRWVISIDPDFEPTECVVTDSGDFKRQATDGGQWIERWSEGIEGHPQGLAYLAEQDDDYLLSFDHMSDYLDGGRLYFINAYGYQLNPSDTDQFWNLPPYWIAGATQAKFVEENVFHRTPRYGEPWVYNYIEVASYAPSPDTTDLWWCGLEDGEDPAQTDNACMTSTEDRVREVASGIRTELDRMMSPTGDPDDAVFHYTPITHTNWWRTSDGRASGFDGWSELHYNYIVFDEKSELDVGGYAEGAFSLVYDAGESSSRVFLKGKFVIDRIKKDSWTTPDLQEQKLLENDLELCNASSEQEANPGSEKN